MVPAGLPKSSSWCKIRVLAQRHRLGQPCAPRSWVCLTTEGRLALVVIVVLRFCFLLFFCFSFVLALPVCACVVCTYMCQCVCKCVFRVEIKGLPLGSFYSHFLSQVISVNLELTNSALLDSQQALPTLLSMPCKLYHHAGLLHTGLGSPHQGPTVCQGMYFTN